MTEGKKLEGFTLEELLEITLTKAKNEPIKNEVPLMELFDRAKERLKENMMSTERGRIFIPRIRSYDLEFPGGKTMYSEKLEELLNIDRITSGLPPLLFYGRMPSSLPVYGSRGSI